MTLIDSPGARSAAFGFIRRRFAICTVAVASSVVIALAGLISPYFSGRIVDALVRKDLLAAVISAGVMAVASVVSAGAWYFGERTWAKLWAEVGFDLRAAVHTAFSRASFASLLVLPQTQARTSLEVEISKALVALQNLVARAVYAGVNILVVLIVVAFIDARLALAAAGLSVPIFFLHRRLISRSAAAEFTLAGRADDVNAAVQRTLTFRALLRVRVFGAADRESRDFASASRLLADATVASSRAQAANVALFLCASTFMTMILVLLSLALVMKGTISIGIFVAFLAYQQIIKSYTEVLGHALSGFAALRVSLARLRPIIDLPVARSGLQRPHGDVLAFRDVSYSYPDGHEALSGVSFEIRRSERVAVVGESGSGKSTLLLLMVGVYEPTEGAVTVDGIEIADCDPTWRARTFALDGDDVELAFGGSTADISYAGESVPDDAVKDALRIARVDWLGRAATTEAGAGALIALSRGQIRRIGIARAIAGGAEYVVFDEPTSSLAPDMGRAIMADLTALGRTVIVATHDRSSLDCFERVLALDRGRIVFDGHPTEFATRKSDAAAAKR